MKEYNHLGLPIGMHTGPRMPLPEGRRAETTEEDLAAGQEMSAMVVDMHGAHEAVMSAQRSIVHKARACGEKLVEIRNKVGDRDWPRWVADHAGFTMATARFYTKLARYMSDPAKAARVEYASLNQLEAIVATEPG